MNIELASAPRIFKTNDFFNFDEFKEPPEENVIDAELFWAMIENECIVKIYAMNFLPGHNYIAVKLKYYWDDKPCSQIIKEPNFKIIKFFWELNNPLFCEGIKYHIRHCKKLLGEFNKEKAHIKDSNQWFLDAILE